MKGYEIVDLAGPEFYPCELRNMVYAFFKKSLRDGNSWFNDIDDSAFQETYTKIIDNILSRPMSVVRLAVLPDGKDVCLGFSIVENKTVHYVFVKTGIAARMKGIGTALLPKEFDTVTHMTKTGREIWKKKYPKVVFNPFKEASDGN